MTNSKMTKRDFFTLIAEQYDGENAVAVRDFCQHEIDLLDNKRASAVRKPSKVQIENETFKADILSFLATADAPATIKTIQANVPTVSDFSTSKMSHLLNALVTDGKVEKTYEKKVAHFAIK